MRRAILAIVVLAAVTASTSVHAAPPPPALAVAQAMTPNPSLATSAEWVLQPDQAGVPAGTAVVSSTPLLGMPTAGSSSFVLFSSGDAPLNLIPTSGQNTTGFVNAAGTDAHAFSVNDINDLTVLRVHIEVPSGANCLAMNVRFLSQEWPQYLGQYNDGFMVELDRNDWVSIDPAAGGGFDAPGNFVFDAQGNPLSVNSTGSFGFDPANAAGTGFLANNDADGGGSELLTAATPVTAGGHDLYFSIFDQGDHGWDSGAMVDNLHAFATAVCPVGAFQPNEPPPLAPVVTAVPPNPSASAPFSFEPQSGDTHANTFECSIDGGPWLSCASGDDFGVGLTDGEHTFQVRAVNSIAIGGPPAALEQFVLDTHADPPVFTARPAAVTNSPTAAVAFAGEAGATFECNLDGAGWAVCSGPVTLTELGEGNHELAVRQTDPLGNVSPAARVDWIVDTTPPAAPAFTVRVSDEQGAAAITIVAEDGDTLECSIDGGPWTSCGSPLRLSGLAPGAHLALVRATDAAGNTGASAVHAFVIAGPAALIPVPPAQAPFVVQVRYRLPITCRAGCTTRAWLYQGHRLVVRQTLLGLRDGLVIRNRGGRVRFFIPITTATLRAAPATMTTTSLTIETRLVVTINRPNEKAITSVRYGHVTVSLGRMASGLRPANLNVL